MSLHVRHPHFLHQGRPSFIMCKMIFLRKVPNNLFNLAIVAKTLRAKSNLSLEN